MLKRRTSMRASKLSCLALLGMASLANGQDMSSQPVELGKVQWRRGFDQAMKQVRAAGKPALLLFQEVPG